MRGYHTSQELIEQCVSLRMKGASINSICQRTRLSKSTVHSFVAQVPLTLQQKALLRQNTRIATVQSNHTRKGISRPWNRVTTIPHFNTELVSCIAHFMFDGSSYNHQTCYYNRSLLLVETQRTLVSRFFGLSGRLYIQRSGVRRLTYNSVEFVYLVHRLQKILLNDIETAPKDWQRAFLRAFFDDEGAIYLSNDKRTRRISGSQKDLDILRLIQRLLSNFGIASSISEPKNRVGVIVIKGGKAGLLRFQQEINFSYGVTMNPKRKNARYAYAIEKREILHQSLASYKK